MTNKRLAINTEGQMTYCSASEENMGKGRCNHISHQKDGESSKEFINRTMFPKSKEAQAAKKNEEKESNNQPKQATAKKYFPATVQVEGFDHNGTVFIKAKDMDEAYVKLHELTKAKDTDFADIFAGSEIEDTNNHEDDFLYSNKVDFDDPMMISFDLTEAFMESKEQLDKDKLNSNKNETDQKDTETAEEIKQIQLKIDKINQEDRDLRTELNELGKDFKNYKGKNRESLMKNVAETNDATYEKLYKLSKERSVLVNKLKELRS